MKQLIWVNIVIGFWLVITAFTQHSDLLRGVRMINDLGVGALLLCCALWYQVERGAAAGLLGVGERQARNVVSDLIERGFLVSEASRAPFRLGFPPAAVNAWFPLLYR